ncbi:MAG: haloacid dehalogenase-like hydrolase [Planctomycetota bacterium]|nr:haloacid dehalogenase-like hydrolase [Planctomycetota bacterium]
MNLALFDIDGTLTDHDVIFDGLYVGIVADRLGNATIDTDWSSYPHCTDSGITDALFRTHRGHPPTSEELVSIRDEYIAALRETPGVAPVIHGSGSALTAVRAAGWAIGIATGNWDSVGRTKLWRARLETDHLPLAGADHAHDRASILEEGVRRCEAHYETTFTRVVYLGDAMWDLRTTRALAMPFVAVGARAEQLAAGGASHALRDYRDLSRLAAALRDARPPR